MNNLFFYTFLFCLVKAFISEKSNPWAKRLGQFTKKEHTFSEAISDKSRARTVFESLQEQFPKEMSYINRTLNGSPYQPCFYNVGSYASAFLYFIETDTTIGD